MIPDELRTDMLGGLFEESLSAYDAMVKSADKVIEKYNQSKEEATNDP